MIKKSISLRCTKDKHDKVYYLQICETEGGYLVQFEYGRTGKNLTYGTKTQEPVGLWQAENIFNAFAKEKKKKGYVEIEDPIDLLMIIGLST